MCPLVWPAELSPAKVNAGWPFTIIWLPLVITGGQAVRQPPVQVWLAAVSPTSSYTVRPEALTSTVPIDVDVICSALVDPLTAVWLCGVLDPVPAAGFAEDELLPHPARVITRAVAHAAPRPNFPIAKADICYLTSGRKHPNGCLYARNGRGLSAVQPRLETRRPGTAEAVLDQVLACAGVR